MRVYLASSFSRQAEMRDVRAALEAYGVEITSRWLEESYSLKGYGKHRFARECAYTDLEDVKRADIVVRFSDDLSGDLIPSKLGTGARMVEFGYALALGKTLIVVSGIQNVFDFLPQVVHLKDTNELIRYLSLEEIH